MTPVTPAEAAQNPPEPEELAKYPSMVVHRGLLPESWFPKWLDRKLLDRERRKRARST